MNRRQLLSGAAGVGMLALGGCSAFQKVASDADILAQAVQSILPTIQSITGMTADVYAKVSTGVASVEAALKQLDTAAAGDLSTVAAKAQAGWAAVQTALSGFQLPAYASTILQAAATALPFILKIAGVAVFAAPIRPPYTYEQAMKILRGAAGVA